MADDMLPFDDGESPSRGPIDQPAAQRALVDQATRDLVRRDGLGETLFVEAGAGSGKTTLLVDRIVNLVLEADVSLASIAAITFTEAAAAELQTRIRATFEQQQAEAEEANDAARAARCARAIADTDLAAISTLHGFANRILGEFAVAAGLPPQVRVLDEVGSQLAQEDRWERFVDQLYDSTDHQDLLQAASALQIPIEPRYANQSTMRAVGSQFNQNWDRLQALIDRDHAPLGDFDFSAFDKAVDELATRPDDCLLTEDRLYPHLLKVLSEMQTVRSIDGPLRKLRALKGAPKWGPGSYGKKEAWRGDSKEQIKTEIKRVEETREEVLGPITDEVLMRLAQVIATETYDAAQARRADGGLEFHDLLVLARDVLRTDPAARRVLHERFRHVLLDEFQDTDPLQIELAVLIATDAEDVTDKKWFDLPVEPGRLFFVGDPKQSIYRFRRADIKLFLQARDEFSKGRGSAKLEANFRTVEPIVRWVNALFEHEMPEEIPDTQPRYQPLVANRSLPSADAYSQHRPVLLGGPHADPKVTAAVLRTEEAADVVGTVRAIVADPSAWPVFDRRTEQWRDAQLSDITILLPTRTSLSFLRAALEEADLRYRIVTGTLVYDTQEVIDALAALRAIDDPGDELSLVAALRSPLYACSDLDLAGWRQAGGRWDVRAAVPPALGEQHPVAIAVAHLASLWRDRWFLTPSMILDRLLRERRAAMLAFGDPRTTDVWRRLRFLIEQARSFEESNTGDLRAFTQWAALQGGAMARVHEPLLPETDEAALSIQTIHGSKGLEFPITILSGMTTQMSNSRNGVSVLWPESGEPSLRLKGGVETQQHGPRADLEDAMDEYEKKRLAYVATTRARDHLIVSCHHKVGKRSDRTYGGRFWNVFDADEQQGLSRRFDWREVVGSQQVEPPGPNQLGLALDNREQWVAERRALLAPFQAPRVLSATGVAQASLQRLSLAAADPASGDQGLDPYLLEVLVDQDDDGSDQPVDEPFARRRGRTGSSIGSAVHGVLQLVDLRSPSGLDDLVQQQCEAQAIPDRTGIVHRLVAAALGSDAVALAAAQPHYKELFVTAPVLGRTIEGYVDLLVETPEGLVVVDYKTDSIRGEEDVDDKLVAYELQAAAYAVALETVTGTAVVDCRFVFCTGSGAIERAVADLDAAKKRVISAIETLAVLHR